MRKLIVLIALLLPASAQGARDGLVVNSAGRQYVYHVRGEAEVAAHCDGRLGCIGERSWTWVTPVWLVDSLRVALWLCAHIEGETELTSKALESIPALPAPAPMCLADRMHGHPDQAGRMQTIEEWEASGSVAPPPSSERATLKGSIVDVMLRPLRGEIVARNTSRHIVADIWADETGQFEVELPVGLYFLRLELEDGRSEGPLILALGPRGHTVPWIVGLTE